MSKLPGRPPISLGLRCYTLEECEALLRENPEGCAALYAISRGMPKGMRMKHRFNSSKGGNVRRMSRSGKAAQTDLIKGRV
jgi:hypothetical protein